MGGGLVGLVTPVHDCMTAVTRAISYYYNKAVVGLLLLLQFSFDPKKIVQPQKMVCNFFGGAYYNLLNSVHPEGRRPEA